MKKKWVTIFFGILLFVYTIYNLFGKICFRPYVAGERSPIYATQPITYKNGFNPYPFLSFTFLSYVFTAITLIWLLVLGREKRIISVIKLVTLISTVVCSMILNFSIIFGIHVHEEVFLYVGDTIFSNYLTIKRDYVLLYTILAIALILDWILFEKKGIIEYKDILYTIGYPFVYFMFSVVNGKFIWKGFYNYEFMNIERKGYGIVFIYFSLIMCIFITYSIFIIYLDKKFLKLKSLKDHKKNGS